MPKGGKLNAKQEMFAVEYLIDLNATQAAIRAGYSEHTAEWIGPQLLGKTHVAEKIRQLMQERTKRTNIDQDFVLLGWAQLASSNIADFVDIQPDGSVNTNLARVTREQLAAVHEITTDEYMDGRGEDARPVKRVKLKLYDKKSALDSVARHLGMFLDKSEVKVTGDLAAVLSAARKRALASGD